jgi:hypothetical protein
LVWVPMYHNPEPIARVLEQQYGLDEILLVIEERLRTASQGDDSATQFIYSFAGSFLSHQLDELTGERLVSFLTCPDVFFGFKNSLRRAYFDRLWRYSRAEALSVLEEVLTHPDADKGVVQDGINNAALDPQPEQRELFLRIVAEAEAGRLDRGFRFHAVHALEEIGEDSPEWRRRLETLSHDEDACLRLLATGALIRRGASERLEERAAAARKQAPPADHEGDHAQGLAVRLLAELAPGASFALFRSLVLTEHDPARHNESAPQEAAHALACAGNPDAVVTLVRAYPIAEEYLSRAIYEYLPPAIDRLEGAKAPIANRIGLWRYARFPP